MQRYQALSAGAEPIESQLQDMLVEYLNAEISLQTVKDITQAVQVQQMAASHASLGPTDLTLSHVCRNQAHTRWVCSVQWLKTTFLAVRVRNAALSVNDLAKCGRSLSCACRH